ncbi:hypothetical protein VNO77_37875 [Canavalia gladiata]|uniref:Uncharacterized protein n=1 Tax=Canavalia gladiata TaxID=3824 RepID=A0AAN9K9A1_CANGL
MGFDTQGEPIAMRCQCFIRKPTLLQPAQDLTSCMRHSEGRNFHGSLSRRLLDSCFNCQFNCALTKFRSYLVLSLNGFPYDYFCVMSELVFSNHLSVFNWDMVGLDASLPSVMLQPWLQHTLDFLILPSLIHVPLVIGMVETNLVQFRKDSALCYGTAPSKHYTRGLDSHAEMNLVQFRIGLCAVLWNCTQPTLYQGPRFSFPNRTVCCAMELHPANRPDSEGLTICPLMEGIQINKVPAGLLPPGSGSYHKLRFRSFAQNPCSYVCLSMPRFPTKDIYLHCQLKDLDQNLSEFTICLCILASRASARPPYIRPTDSKVFVVQTDGMYDVMDSFLGFMANLSPPFGSQVLGIYSLIHTPQIMDAVLILVGLLTAKHSKLTDTRAVTESVLNCINPGQCTGEECIIQGIGQIYGCEDYWFISLFLYYAVIRAGQAVSLIRLTSVIFEVFYQHLSRLSSLLIRSLINGGEKHDHILEAVTFQQLCENNFFLHEAESNDTGLAVSGVMVWLRQEAAETRKFPRLPEKSFLLHEALQCFPVPKPRV